MSGYEYLCVDIGFNDAEGRTEILNEYAAKGWELVTAGVWWAYFRRIISEVDELITSEEYEEIKKELMIE